MVGCTTQRYKINQSAAKSVSDHTFWAYRAGIRRGSGSSFLKGIEVKTTKIVEEIGKNFRVFGGDTAIQNNPIAVFLKGKPLQFAAGVDVKSVVFFIRKKLRR